jgi:RNA recognition motif-containing protein
MRWHQPIMGLARVACFSPRPIVGNKLYVGNLSYGMTDSDLQKLFEPHGTVETALLPKARRPRTGPQIAWCITTPFPKNPLV